ncbi:MAG: hypothetical protein LBK73_03445 [Treponema sp.]|nr:hypothetical protein [Treponema sp.]
MKEKDVKKFFLFLFVLLAGAAWASAAPFQSGGGDDASQMAMPLEDVELICLWAGQYKAGLLTHDEFKTLVAGRIVVMYMRDQTRSEGMGALAEKTRKKVDRSLYVSRTRARDTAS